MNLKLKIRKSDANMAEFIGILLGDGSLCLRNRNSRCHSRLQITFNSKDDVQYISYVKKLLKALFGIEPILKFRNGENTADLQVFNRELIDYLVTKIGLRLSPKWENARIPEAFLKNGLDLDVVRGYFDTDGSLVTANNNRTTYPRLEMKISPSPMQNQLIDILKRHNLKFGVYQIGKGKVRVQLNGKKQLEKWNELIGFSNKKHEDKLKRFL